MHKNNFSNFAVLNKSTFIYCGSKMSDQIKSPCINVCKYDEDNVCMGCYRKMEEITGWLFMDNDRKMKILEKAEERRRTPKSGKNDYDYYV